MGKINIDNVYKGRLDEIEKQIKKSIYNKSWTEVAKLKAEKNRLLELIEK